MTAHLTAVLNSVTNGPEKIPAFTFFTRKTVDFLEQGIGGWMPVMENISCL